MTKEISDFHLYICRSLEPFPFSFHEKWKSFIMVESTPAKFQGSTPGQYLYSLHLLYSRASIQKKMVECTHARFQGSIPGQQWFPVPKYWGHKGRVYTTPAKSQVFNTVGKCLTPLIFYSLDFLFGNRRFSFTTIFVI